MSVLQEIMVEIKGLISTITSSIYLRISKIAAPIKFTARETINKITAHFG